MQKLYEVYLANRVTGRTEQPLILAASETDAINLAAIRVGITEEDLPRWAKSAVYIMDVPDANVSVE